MSEDNYVNMINFALELIPRLSIEEIIIYLYIYLIGVLLFIILSTKITRSGRRDRGGDLNLQFLEIDYFIALILDRIAA